MCNPVLISLTANFYKSNPFMYFAEKNYFVFRAFSVILKSSLYSPNYQPATVIGSLDCKSMSFTKEDNYYHFEFKK